MSSKTWGLAVSCIPASAATGVVALKMAIWCAAGGHGSYLPARLLFPLTMLTTVVYEEITAVGVIIAIAQFPIYGCVVAWGVLAGRGRATGVMVLLAHLSLVLFALIVVSYELAPAWRVPPELFS